jgi:hypothetical protein
VLVLSYVIIIRGKIDFSATYMSVLSRFLPFILCIHRKRYVHGVSFFSYNVSVVTLRVFSYIVNCDVFLQYIFKK